MNERIHHGYYNEGVVQKLEDGLTCRIYPKSSSSKKGVIKFIERMESFLCLAILFIRSKLQCRYLNNESHDQVIKTGDACNGFGVAISGGRLKPGDT